jgi:hypothetical protein
MLDAITYWAELRRQLIGQSVSDRMLAANSLSIWVATSKADERAGWTIWLDPTWHVRGPSGLIAGSRQAQDEEDPGGWAAATKAVDLLIGRTVEAIGVDGVTHDLTLTLSGGVVAQTFAADPRDDDQWRIRALGSGVLLCGSNRDGLRLVQKV